MANRLTLTLPPGLGGREVEVVGRRFSIGRIPENDLVLDDTSLSRRHALIEDLDGVFNLSDCGSSNGTLINGQAVTGVAVLSDEDVLTFGGVGDILVRIHDDAHPSQTADHPALLRGTSARYSPSDHLGHGQKAMVNSNNHSWLSPPVIAVSASVLILLVASAVLLVTKGWSGLRPDSRPGVARKQQPILKGDDNTLEGNDNARSETAPSPDTIDVNPGTEADTGSVELAPIEAAASNVLSSISKDTHPVLTEKPVRAINAQVQRYRSSPSLLRDELRAMKRNIVAVSTSAKSSGLRTPLAVYATLATIDRDGGRGEPTQVAGQLCPALAKMRSIFGDELANDSLLTVAALEEGAGLQFRITKLAGQVKDSPTTIRSIWYLHEHGIIKEETYNFVLRFLAIGVIAQNPQKFGIAADPLTF